MAALLELDNVEVSIDTVSVLQGVSLSVDAGEAVAVIGRNGAGKTTTFRSIMGLVPVSAGRIQVNGEDITAAPPQSRPRYGIAFAPDDRRLFTDLTVDDNLRMAMWGSPKESTESQYNEILEDILGIFPEIEEFLDRPAGQLSGGQQKMVAVSRALAADPDLILLDEPFEGLAPSVRSRFSDGITDIQGLGVSILLAESNVRHAQTSANRFYVLDRGEIISEIHGSQGLTSEDSIKRVFGDL